MKGITRKILETLAEGTLDFIDLQVAILEAGYGATPNKIEYVKRRISKERNEAGKILAEIFKANVRYSNLLSKLKNDGLIKKTGSRHKSIIKITRKGLEKLKILKEKTSPPIFYNSAKQDNIVIVIFDIPEKDRRKRDWLRSVLKHLRFKMVQKSVWIGKSKIPKQLLKDLRDEVIIDFVEIFEITKTGSLRDLTNL